MSDQNSQPSVEQIREARHAGCNDSIAHMPDDRRERISSSFQTQDARREHNVASFVNTVAGGE